MKLNRSHILLTVIVLMAAALRFFEIDRLPFWFDERLTLKYAGSGFSVIWTELPKRELSPPFYYSLVRLWLSFGQSEFVLRSMSAIFSIATVPIVYAAGRLVAAGRCREWSATAAALLFACSPLHVTYAQEARPYAALTFSIALSLLGMLWLMRHPDLARIPRLGFAVQSPPMEAHRTAGRPAMAWLAWIAGLALCLWLHNAGPIYVAPMAFSAAVWWAGRREGRMGLGWNLMLSAVAVFCVWAPNLPLLWHQLPHTDPMVYIRMPSLLDIAKVFKFLFSLQYAQTMDPLEYLISLPAAVDLLTGCLVILGILTIRRHSGSNVTLLLLSITFGPMLLALLASHLYHPIFLGRIFVASSIPFFLALGVCLEVFQRRLWRVLILSVWIAVSLSGLWTYYQTHEKPKTVVVLRQDTELKH